jgi:hypothetical protein
MIKIFSHFWYMALISMCAVVPQLTLAHQVYAQESTAAEAIGTIEKPPGVELYDTAAGVGEGEIGILFFISRMITVVTIFSGLWVFLNIILAGYTYVTSPGGAQTHTKVRDKLTMSLLGLVLIVTVYTLGGLIGTIFFGDASFILNPTITGPTP